MRRIWLILALAVGVGAALFLVARGTGPAGWRADPMAPAVSPAKAAFEAVPSEAPADAGEETATPPAPEPLRGDWTIEGRVVRERDGDLDPTLEPVREPVAGAAIRVRLAPPEEGEEDPPPHAPREVTTGPDGRFAVAGLPGKTRLEIEVNAPGNALKVILQRLEGTEPYRDIGDIVLRPASTLIVRLVDRHGMPVEGGRVIINDLGEDGPDAFSESPRESIERGGGEYTADRLPPVHCSVEASAAGWAPSLTWVELPRAEPLVVRLGEGISLTGTVRASTGEPIAGAQVVAKDDRTFPDVECETDASGRFQLRNIRNYLYDIEATAEEFHRTIRSFDEGEDIEIWLIREAIVEGKVVAEDDGQPLAGVSVDLHPVESDEYVHAETDERGDFLVQKLLPGTYYVDFDHDDYVPVREGPWDIKGGEKHSGVLLRLRRGFTAQGTVADARTGQPVENASVSARQETGDNEPDLERGEWTDRSGAFELRGLAPGEYTIRVEARGYLGTETSIRLTPEDAGPLALAIEKGGSISGCVLDHTGRPLPGVRIYLDAPRDAPHVVARAVGTSERPVVGARGRYLLDGLPPFDRYSLLAYHEDLGYSRVAGIALGSGADITGLDIQFPAAGSMRGRVVDEAGHGLEGATVNLYSEEEKRADVDQPPHETFLSWGHGGLPSREARTSADGTYEVKNIPAGLYRVSAAAYGWASQEERSIRIGEGLTVEGIDFVFSGGVIVTGRIVNDGGLGIVGASVGISAGGREAYTTTISDGRFVVFGLQAGRGDLSASQEGFGSAVARISLPSQDLLLVLRPLGKIAGRVEAPGRSAFQKGDIRISYPEARAQADTCVSTDESGRFSASIEPGPIVVIADVPGFARSEVETTLAPGERREVVVPLRRGGTIEGTVVSRQSGEPVESAEVHLASPGGSRAGMTTFTDDTDDEGAFSIDDVPEGPVVIVVRHAEHRAARQGIQVLAGETAETRIELEGGQGIHGRVSHHGKPVPGAKVAVLGPGRSATTETVSGPGGLYEVLGLAPGEYDISVEAAGPGGRPLVLRRRVTVQAGQLTERDLDLGAVLVTGRVLRNGAPAAEVRISASSLGEELEDGTPTTDSSGEYSLDLPGGREVDLTITSEGKILADIDLVLPEGPGELRRDIDLGALAFPVDGTR